MLGSLSPLGELSPPLRKAKGLAYVGKDRELISLGDARELITLGDSREFVSLGELREFLSPGEAREFVSNIVSLRRDSKLKCFFLARLCL